MKANLKRPTKKMKKIKNELKNRNELEFQKIKSDCLETKKLIKKFQLSYINDDRDNEEFE